MYMYIYMYARMCARVVARPIRGPQTQGLRINHERLATLGLPKWQLAPSCGLSRTRLPRKRQVLFREYAG